MNLYAYCGGDPVNRRDELGLWYEGDGGPVGIGGVGAEDDEESGGWGGGPSHPDHDGVTDENDIPEDPVSPEAGNVIEAEIEGYTGSNQSLTHPDWDGSVELTVESDGKTGLGFKGDYWQTAPPSTYTMQPKTPGVNIKSSRMYQVGAFPVKMVFTVTDNSITAKPYLTTDLLTLGGVGGTIGKKTDNALGVPASLAINAGPASVSQSLEDGAITGSINLGINAPVSVDIPMDVGIKALSDYVLEPTVETIGDVFGWVGQHMLSNHRRAMGWDNDPDEN